MWCDSPESLVDTVIQPQDPARPIMRWIGHWEPLMGWRDYDHSCPPSDGGDLNSLWLGNAEKQGGHGPLKCVTHLLSKGNPPATF